MEDNALTVPAYDPARGVVAPVEGGNVTVEVHDGTVEIFGDRAGLRDLARWCLALADERAPSGAHIHLDPGIVPLTLGSVPVMLAREDSSVRLTFFVESVRPVPEGWLFHGEPGFDPRFWARPGDVFDAALNEAAGDERAVALVVRELTASSLLASGTGGETVRAGDILSGERRAEPG